MAGHVSAQGQRSKFNLRMRRYVNQNCAPETKSKVRPKARQLFCRRVACALSLIVAGEALEPLQ